MYTRVFLIALIAGFIGSWLQTRLMSRKVNYILGIDRKVIKYLSRHQYGV